MTLLATLSSGLRAVALRPARVNPGESGPGIFFGLIPVYLIVSIALAALGVPRPWEFVAYAVPTVLTDALLTLAAAWVLVCVMQREATLWGVAATLLAATIATSIVVQWPLQHAAIALIVNHQDAAALLVDMLSRWWWLLVLFAFARRLAPRNRARALVAALLAFAVSAAAWWWLPALSLVQTASTDTSGDVGETAPAGTGGETEAGVEPDFDAEHVIYSQSDLLDAAVDRLTPQTPGKIDLYVLAFAGDGEEDVFRNEAEYAETLFAKRFDAQGHVLVLENNPATVSTRPLATLTNLTWALDGIARKMDPAEDVLLLYVTSHGSEDHQLLVDLDPLPLNQIGPNDLADALKTNPGIRWKVLVVNACYSGGFIGALRDDSTMVITSARADRTSFGCGSESDITYFGKAFLAEALNKTTSIREAFDLAKQSVADWEDDDKEKHSEPQIASTHSIEAKLETWRKALNAGAAVPFVPATPAP